MSRVSVRQPIVIYATVFMFLITVVVVCIAGVSMIRGTHKAFRRAVATELRAMLARGNLRTIREEIAARPKDLEVEFAIVSTTEAPFGLTLEAANVLAQKPDSSPSFIAHRVTTEPSEIYLVARFDRSVPYSIAVVELTRMIPFSLFGALGCAAILAFMIGRLLLPPLSALGEIARDSAVRTDGLVSEDAPNEILEVAQSFRRTLRQLKEERERIAAQHQELERMHASLVRASKLASVGRLAAGIAHEIGNPLAAVQGYLAILPKLDEEERKEVVERSAKELQRIHETIKKLLAYARRDEPSEPPRPIALSQVIGDAVILVKGHPAIRNVEVMLELGPDGAPDAVAHPGGLGQVLVNLLLNAGQALEGRAAPRIEIRRRIEGENVEVSVEDNGPGIEPDKLELIFDPFYTTKAPGEGTGLGLAVSRSLIESMEGDLTVTSGEGKGARFVIRLKAVRP